MSDAIWATIITAVVSLIGIFATYKANSKKIVDELSKQNAEFQRKSAEADAKLTTQLAVLGAELAALSKAVDKHNNYAERVPKLEQQVKDIDKRLEHITQSGG